jgi:homoserine kinase
MIALCPEGRSEEVARAMKGEFAALGVACESYVTRVGRGVEII